MASPVNHRLLDAVSAAGASADTRLKGHTNVTLFVRADALDSANDTLSVALEASPDGDHWTDIADPADADKKLAASDFTEDPDTAGVYTASITVSEVAFEFVRARIADYTDSAGGDLAVTAWVMANGNGGGSGARGNPDGP